MRTHAETEELRQQQQVLIDAQKTLAQRNAMGQFATPPALATEIAEYVRELWGNRRSGIRFLEPALGTGSFFSALLHVFPEHLEAACGVEIDPVFAEAARHLWEPFGLRVICDDFTRLAPPEDEAGRYNLIVTNPPYVRHHHLRPDEKARLKAAVRSSLQLDVSGLAGLYAYFLLIADKWLQDDGLSVWLIPTEWMEVNYGTVIRDYLTRKVSLIHVHRFDPDDVQFDDALVSSAIVIFQKTPPADGHQVLFSHGGTIRQPLESEQVAVSTLRHMHKWTRLLLSVGQRNRANRKCTLSDLFKIQRGLATGDNSFFVMPRAKAIGRGLPEQYLRPVLPSPRKLKQSVIEAAPDGHPIVPEQLVLLDCDLPEDEIAARYPALAAYLRDGQVRGVHKGYLASRRQPWYRQEQRPAAPFLCTYMGRQNRSGKPFRFIWNQSDALATNVYLLLYPQGPLRAALAQDPTLYPVIFDLLQSISMEDILGEGRTYGGGLHKLEPKELGRVSAARFLDVIGSVPAAAIQTEFPWPTL